MASDATIPISKMAANADDDDHRAFDENAWHAFRKGDGAITIFDDDDGAEIEQQDGDDGGAGDSPAAASIDLAAVVEAAKAKVAEIIDGFPRRQPRLTPDEKNDGWSIDDRDVVGKVLVRPVNVAKQGHAAEYKKTYVVCVAVCHEFVEELTGRRLTGAKRFRVLYGVRRRHPSGIYMKDAFEEIDEKTFKEALPQSDFDVATAEALREALDTRPAAPPSSGAPAPAEHPKLAELRKDLANRGTNPALLDGWTIDDESNRPFVHPVTGFHYNRSCLLRLLDVGKAESRRTETSRKRSKPQAWDTAFARYPSCVEREGTVCTLCRRECHNLEDLMRHRLAEHEGEDPIGDVQAPWKPPQGVPKVGEPCGRCRECLEEYDWGTREKGRRSPLQPGAVFDYCDNANAGRCRAFCMEVAENKRAIAQYRHERGRTGPPATAPSKKRAKKSDKTTKR